MSQYKQVQSATLLMFGAASFRFLSHTVGTCDCDVNMRLVCSWQTLSHTLYIDAAVRIEYWYVNQYSKYVFTARQVMHQIRAGLEQAFILSSSFKEILSTTYRDGVMP